MKELLEKIIEIVEKNNGNQEATEKDLTEFIEANKEVLEQESDKMTKAIDVAVKLAQEQNAGDINAIMNAMFETMAKFMGQDNFNKMLELEKKYPFVKDITKKILPKTNK